MAFEQVTGPVARAEVSESSSVTVLLESSDAAKTWTKQREVPAPRQVRRTGVDNGYLAPLPASSSFCGHAMATADDGTLVTTAFGPVATEPAATSNDPLTAAKPGSGPIYFPRDPADFQNVPDANPPAA